MADKSDGFGGAPNYLSKTELKDCICRICMCILIEPVTMPCRHELCLKCFKKNVHETSLVCPFCRLRISSWARKCTRSNTLIDNEKWSKIMTLFPDAVRRRMEGHDDDIELDPVTNIKIAGPGEIRKEYEEQLHKLQAEQEQFQREEELASERFIKELRKEEEKLEQEWKKGKERQNLSDEQFARELSTTLNAEGDVNIGSPEFNKLLKKCQSRVKVEQTPTNRNGPMDAIIHSIKRHCDVTVDDDRIRFTCLSPSDKPDESVERLNFDDMMTSNSSDNSPVSVRNVPHMKNKNSHVVPSSTLSSGSKNTHNVSNSKASDRVPGSTAPHTITSGKSKKVYMKSTVKITPLSLRCKSETSSIQGSQKDNNKARSSSADSISHECNHFRPIRVCPRTPPRRLPCGKVLEAPVIISTPRNLSKQFEADSINSKGDCSPTVSYYNTRGIQALAKDRNDLVQSQSKATNTTSLPLKRLHHDAGMKRSLSGLEKEKSNADCDTLMPELPKIKRIKFELSNPTMEIALDDSDYVFQEPLLPLHANVNEDDFIAELDNAETSTCLNIKRKSSKRNKGKGLKLVPNELNAIAKDNGYKTKEQNTSTSAVDTKSTKLSEHVKKGNEASCDSTSGDSCPNGGVGTRSTSSLNNKSSSTCDTTVVNSTKHGASNVPITNMTCIRSDNKEEQDRLFAEKLQKQFNLEAKLALTDRRKGSKDEYDLRKKPKPSQTRFNTKRVTS